MLKRENTHIVTYSAHVCVCLYFYLFKREQKQDYCLILSIRLGAFVFIFLLFVQCLALHADLFYLTVLLVLYVNKIKINNPKQ